MQRSAHWRRDHSYSRRCAASRPALARSYKDHGKEPRPPGYSTGINVSQPHRHGRRRSRGAYAEQGKKIKGDLLVSNQCAEIILAGITGGLSAHDTRFRRLSATQAHHRHGHRQTTRGTKEVAGPAAHQAAKGASRPTLKTGRGVDLVEMIVIVGLSGQRDHVPGVSLDDVFREEFFFRILIPRDHSELPEDIDVDPGEVQLVPQKARAGASRVQVVIIMPFAGEHAGTRLIDGEIAAVEIDPVAMFGLATAMTRVIEGPDESKPQHGGGEQGAGQRRTAD